MASTASTTYVNALYTNLLGFNDPAGVTAWANQIDAGTSPYNVANAFLDVYQTSAAPVALLYEAAFGRLPDYEGFTFWLNNYKTVSNGSLETLSRQFYNSAEFAAKMGGDPTSLADSTYVQNLYLNVLGHAGDAGGVAYWTGVLAAEEAKTDGSAEAKAVVRNQLLDTFTLSAENVATHGKDVETFTVYTAFDNRAPTATELTTAVTLAEATTVTSVVGASPNYGATGAAPVPIFALSVVADPASIAEGTTGKFTVTTNVEALADLTYNISVVGDTLGGSASAASAATDFSGTLPTSVKVTAGAKTSTFDITAKADNAAEGPEGFKVTLLNGATPVVSTTALITDATVDTTAPVVTAGQTINYAENQKDTAAVLGTVKATDNVAVTGYEITSGNTDGFFAIGADGTLTLTEAGLAAGKASNDFETTPNSFTLGIVASDAVGNKSDAVNVTLNVTDVDDRAPLLTGGVVNGTRSVLIYDETLGATKTPAISDFAVGLKGAAGSVAVTGVEVTGTTVVLTLGRAPAPGETFVVTYTPGANPVEDVAGNDVAPITALELKADTTAPVITAGQTISYVEDIITGVQPSRTTTTVLGQVKATDNTGVVAYNITAGNDSGFFAVDGSGNITLTTKGLAGASNDFEVTPNSFVLTMTATDGGGNVSASQQVTLAVTNDTRDDAPPPPTPAVITLTTGADNATPTSLVANTKTTASNDSITGFVDGATAANSTLTLADAIDGGGGTADNLIVTLNKATVNSGNTPVLNGIEVLTIRSTGTASTADLTAFTPSVDTLIFDSTSVDVTVSKVANQVKTFGVTNSPQVAAKVIVQSATGLTGTSDAVTINVSNNLGKDTLATTLQIEGSAAGVPSGYELVTINSNGGASFLQALSVGDKGFAATTLTSLTVSGASNLTINDALAFTGTTGTVLANNFAGNLNLTFDGGVKTDNTITGGSGNDRFNFASAGEFKASDIINGGTGTDTLSLADVTIDNTKAALVAAINATTSIEVLEQTAGAPVLEASQLTQINSFVFSNAAAAAKVTGVENTDSFTFTGAGPGASSFAAKADSAADVLNLTFSRADGLLLGASIDAKNFETVNITVTSANGTISLDGKLGVGDAGWVIDAAAGGTINVLGGAAAELLLGTGANINAGTATGKLSLSGSATANSITGGTNDDIILGLAGNDTINGGNGNDTITGGADADQLTGGTGNDTFVITKAAETATTGVFAATDTSTANIDRITDFVGNGALAGDVIQVTTAAYTTTTGNPASVTAFTVASASNFNDLAGALAGIQASSATLLSVADVTVSAGSLAGRYLIINDATAGYTVVTDSIIGLTGITGALNAQDFVVVA